jgi:hypothetical protein
MNRLWTRLGDAGEYEEYGADLAPIADTLRELGVRPHELAQVHFGLVGPGFEQANYISLYWGGEDADFVADLSRDEFEELRREMARASEAQAVGR